GRGGVAHALQGGGGEGHRDRPAPLVGTHELPRHRLPGVLRQLRGDGIDIRGGNRRARQGRRQHPQRERGTVTGQNTMAAEQTTLTPAEYIAHHLTFLTEPVGQQGGFWTLNVDSVMVSVILGLLGLGFFYWVAKGTTTGVPTRRQAFVEMFFSFVDR